MKHFAKAALLILIAISISLGMFTLEKNSIDNTIKDNMINNYGKTTPKTFRIKSFEGVSGMAPRVIKISTKQKLTIN